MSNIRQCGRIGCDKDDNHTSPHTYEDAIPSSAKRSAAEARIHEESKSSKRKDCSVRFYWCKGEESDTERPALEVSQIENLDTLKGAVSCAWVENVIPTLMESNYNSISKALGHFMQANNIQLGSTGYYPNKKHVLCVNKSGDPDRLGNYIDNGKMKEFLTRFTSPAPTLAPSYRIKQWNSQPTFIWDAKLHSLVRIVLNLAFLQCYWRTSRTTIGKAIVAGLIRFRLNSLGVFILPLLLHNGIFFRQHHPA